MIASAHQPVYQPWLGLVHKIANADVWVAWDDVAQESSGFENRQRILGTGGEQWITVPCRRSRDAKIKDLLIANEHDWQRKHFRAIELGYAKAPHWKHYEPLLRWLYVESKWGNLVDLNEQILTFLLREFEINVRRVKLSGLGLTTTKAQLVLDACKKVGAYKYVFGAKGIDYADPALFRAAGVEPFVQEYRAVEYPQVGRAAFTPNLWAFDVLLNVGPERGREVMLAGGMIRRMG